MGKFNILSEATAFAAPTLGAHAESSVRVSAVSFLSVDPNAAWWLNNMTHAGQNKSPVTFPIGDWFLGAGDGSVGRGEDSPAGGALIMKGSPADLDSWKRPPKYPKMHDVTSEEQEKQWYPQGQPEPADYAWEAPAGVREVPEKAYGGELQLLEDFRSQTVRWSDITDSGRWTCPKGPGPGANPVAGRQHPQVELNQPAHLVHVHLEDKSAGPFGRTLWDAIYDMGGTEVLKATAKAKGGNRPNMELICPPRHGPPHWYEFTVSKAGPQVHGQKRSWTSQAADSVGVGGPQSWGRKRSLIQDFLGSQVISSYRPDHDPQMSAFTESLDKDND